MYAGFAGLFFYSVSVSSWWSRGWFSFSDFSLDYFRVLDIKVIRFGELGFIRLNSLVRFFKNDIYRGFDSKNRLFF